MTRVRSSRELAKLRFDMLLRGCAWIDERGCRVDPDDVRVGADGHPSGPRGRVQPPMIRDLARLPPPRP